MSDENCIKELEDKITILTKENQYLRSVVYEVERLWNWQAFRRVIERLDKWHGLKEGFDNPKSKGE